MSDRQAKVSTPFNNAEVQALTATGVQALLIESGGVLVDGAAVPATGNRTLNLTLHDQLKIGDRLIVKTIAAGTETTIFGTNCVGVTYTGVAGKTFVTELYFDGTNFIQIAAALQID